MILRRVPLPAPAVLAAVLVAGAALRVGIHPLGGIRAVLIAAAAGLVLWFVLAVAVRDPDWAAVLGLPLVGAVWSPDRSEGFLVLAGLVVLAGLLRRLRFPRVRWRPAAAAALVFSAALMVSPILDWIAWGGPRVFWADLTAGPPPAGPTGRTTAALPLPSDQGPSAPGDAPTVPPDIYLILLDEHTRQDRLISDFGADDADFLAALEARGFTVSPQSRSNYDLTSETVASMLQMAYLDDIPAVAAELARGGDHLDVAFREAANDNPVFAILKAHGYSLVAVAPWYEHIALRRVDTFLDGGELNEFELSLLMNTRAGQLLEAVDPAFLGQEFRSRIESVFQQAAAVAASPATGPRFVFVHVPAPHEPYVFTADGSPAPLRLADLYGPYVGPPEATWPRRRAYAAQLAYVDTRTIELVDAILAAASQPPVIVVFGDHGSRIPVTSDPVSSAEARVDNLFAALTPGHPGLFGPAPTLINVFPVLLDAYLGAGIPQRPDRSYVYWPQGPEVPGSDRLDSGGLALGAAAGGSALAAAGGSALAAAGGSVLAAAGGSVLAAAATDTGYPLGR
jgi:hypothetical protein